DGVLHGVVEGEDVGVVVVQVAHEDDVGLEAHGPAKGGNEVRIERDDGSLARFDGEKRLAMPRNGRHPGRLLLGGGGENNDRNEQEENYAIHGGSSQIVWSDVTTLTANGKHSNARLAFRARGCSSMD